MEENSTLVMGPNGERFAQVVNILGGLTKKYCLKEADVPKVKGLIHQMSTDKSCEIVFQGAFAALPPKEQEQIKSFMS